MFDAPVLFAVFAVIGLADLQFEADKSKGAAQPTWRTVFSFQNEGATGKWSSINDGVMGGLSHGRFRITQEGTLEFSGEVSLENNGGFASIRSQGSAIDLSDFDGLVARVRGDGKRYAFSAVTDYPIMAGAYYQSFETKPGQWQDIHLPFEDFRAKSFGQPIMSAPPLNKREIRSLGLLISDKQRGPFKLEVDWLKAVRALDTPSVGEGKGEANVHASASGLIETAIVRGAPLFNAGQPEACAAVYELTARSLVELCPYELPLPVVESLRDGLRESQRQDDPANRAWVLRHALDAAWKSLTQADPLTKTVNR